MVDPLLLLSFDGTQVPAELVAALGRRDIPGVTLFRRNLEGVEHTRALTESLQGARTPGRPPLLVAADQEGGQLMAVGPGTTPFPGNMALGATGDEALAERVARAVGRELRAAGVNVNYAPVCDVATNPRNPSLGLRSFGEDPALVGRLAAATVRGLQAEGVAATLKHFPGKGEAELDPHHDLPRLDLDRERLDAVELAPFRAGVAAGARVVMVGHYDVPSITGQPGLPTSLSPRALGEVLRRDLGFDGVIVTDALNMGALGTEGRPDVAAATRAGADLLLCAGSLDQEALRDALERALGDGGLEPATVDGAARRTEGLRRWVGTSSPPGPEVVGCPEHLELAGEVAARSVTLVRDEAGLLPLRLGPEASILAVMPAPRDLTPADTSSTVPAGLASALRGHHPTVEEAVVGHPPTDGEIAAVRHLAARHDLVVVGTLDAFRDPGQAALVAALLEAGPPVLTLALRTPHDLAAYPQARTHACTYGILAPSLRAVAAALWGAAPFEGRLPAAVPGLYPAGHGLPT